MDTLARVLAHKYEGSPRHGIVCAIDVSGFLITAGLLSEYQPRPVVAILLFAMILQYAVSFTFHFLPRSEFFSKLDRSMIFLLIAATYVPFWGTKLPYDDAIARLVWVAVIAVCGIALLVFGAPTIVNSVLWSLFAFGGLAFSFKELQQWLPMWPLLLFFFGAALYFLQLVVFSKQWFDFKPGLFGFREVQHVLLLCATTIHALVVLNYLQ